MRMWICSGLIRLYQDNIGHRKRTIVFRHVFISYLNADSFRVHAYTFVYSYKCNNWDLQYIDRHTTPPPLYTAAAVQLLVFFFIQSKYWTHRTVQQVWSRYSFSAFHITCLPVSLLVYLAISTFQASGYTSPDVVPIPPRSVNIFEWNTFQTRTCFPSMCLHD